jgi:hypothetical protein
MQQANPTLINFADVNISKDKPMKRRNTMHPLSK